MSDVTTQYITNPQTSKPVRVGSRVYNKLVRQCIINPDDYNETLPTPRERGRPKKMVVGSRPVGRTHHVGESRPVQGKPSYKLVDKPKDTEPDNRQNYNEEELDSIIEEEEEQGQKTVSYEEAEQRERRGVGEGRDPVQWGYKERQNQRNYKRFGLDENGQKPNQKNVWDQEQEERKLMRRVAKCTANSIKHDPQKFEGMSEDDVMAMLQKMIMEELGDSEEEKSD